MKYLNKKVTAFTSYGSGFLKTLVNEILISEAYNPKTPPDPLPKRLTYQAIWDTGATNTVISQNVANDLGLHPTGRTRVSGVHGPEEVNTYLVNVYLPNNVGFPGVRVTEGKLVGCDVLIGMDIIRSGDLAISNFNNRTIFSFRFPSIEETDYQMEINNETKAMKKNSDPRIYHRMNNGKTAIVERLA